MQYCFENFCYESLMFRILRADNNSVGNVNLNNDDGLTTLDLSGVTNRDILNFRKYLLKPSNEDEHLGNLEIDNTPQKEFNNWFLIEEITNNNDGYNDDFDSPTDRTELYDYDELFV